METLSRKKQSAPIHQRGVLSVFNKKAFRRRIRNVVDAAEILAQSVTDALFVQ